MSLPETRLVEVRVAVRLVNIASVPPGDRFLLSLLTPVSYTGLAA